MPGGRHPLMRAWEPEEDHILLETYDEIGPRWKDIMKRIPGRTQAMCRNRYQRINAPKKGTKSRNRCTHCGHTKRGHTCIARLKKDIAPLQLEAQPSGMSGVSELSGHADDMLDDDESFSDAGYPPPADAPHMPPTPVAVLTPVRREPSWHIEIGVERAAGLYSAVTGGFEMGGSSSGYGMGGYGSSPLRPPPMALQLVPELPAADLETPPPDLSELSSPEGSCPGGKSPLTAAAHASGTPEGAAAAGVEPHSVAEVVTEPFPPALAASSSATPSLVASVTAAGETANATGVLSSSPLLSRARSNNSMNVMSHALFARAASCDPLGAEGAAGARSPRVDPQSENSCVLSRENSLGPLPFARQPSLTAFYLKFDD